MAIADSGPVTTRPAFSAGILRISRDGFTHGLLWTMLLLLYLLSGVLTIATGNLYRMGLMSFLVLPLLLVRGLRIDRIFLAFTLLVGVVLASGVVNDSTLTQILTFLRIPIFAYLVYYLISVAVNADNIRRILRFLLIVATVQLPIILFQWWAFDKVPDSFKMNVGIVDWGFGTFNYKTDYSMSFLLTLLVAWLLLDPHRSSWVRFRWPLAIWYSLTVFVAAAQIMKVGVVLMWLIFIVTHLQLRTMVRIAAAALLLYFAAGALYRAGGLSEDPLQFVNRLQTESNKSNPDRYLSGSYDRWGALWYFLSGNVAILGDGPSTYADPVARTQTRGNNGHFFTFISEIGPVGWLASVLVYAAIAFPIRRGRIRIGLLPLLYFVLINLLSFTSAVMNDMIRACEMKTLIHSNVLDAMVGGEK
ncbi:MAG: hypothetical protein NTZ50_14990 [Chloroflexi bacterium]|nr:hypothetical protein [Chloroflexota bacterium]